MAAACLLAVPAFASEAPASQIEDTQNPVMNFAGDYVYARARMNVSCEDTGDAKFFVTWSSSAAEHSEWEMSGRLDPETLSVAYDNCTMKTIVFNENGEIESETVDYENGTGTIVFTDEPGSLALTWTDDQGITAENTVFEYLYPYEEETTEDAQKEDSGSPEEMAADEDAMMLHGNITTEIENGILTIRMEATDHDKKDMWWQFWNEPEGAAAKVEVITEADTEEGMAYTGSFKALEGLSGEEDTEGLVRLVHTNGDYIAEYLEWNVKIEKGQIVEVTGGGQAFPTTGEELAPYLTGTWQEENGTKMMEITLGEDGGLDVVISDGSGRDGMTSFNTMTAFYDVIREDLVYRNGAQVTGAITDGEGQEAAEETAAEDSSGSEARGTGSFHLDVSSESEEEHAIVWTDDTFGNGEARRFVKTEK